MATLSACYFDFWTFNDLVFISAKMKDQTIIPGLSEFGWPPPPPGEVLDVEFRSARGSSLYTYAESHDFSMGSDQSICSNRKYDPSKSLSGWGFVFGVRGRVKMQGNPAYMTLRAAALSTFT
jgi:hypothetical protein